ncbi:MAG: septum formation protein Maf [Candidatus Hydrogenedens sp.]|jgi:septum formation protein|nr:septum formation protein Maf [Candidatus Hydrogenedens sp.]
MKSTAQLSVLLASASPRRKALLGALGASFDVWAAQAEEIDEGHEPEAIVIGNAERKCRAAVEARPHHDLVISADTLVFLDGQVLSKPADLEEAKTMLRALSGRTHHVVTGLALFDRASGCYATGAEKTGVRFRELSDEEIACFVNTVKPVDRAGAYTVDGPGSLLVAAYDGCYQNVLGLPLVRLDLVMRTLGYSLFEMINGDEARFL